MKSCYVKEFREGFLKKKKSEESLKASPGEHQKNLFGNTVWNSSTNPGWSAERNSWTNT